MKNKRNRTILLFVIVCFNSAFTASLFDLTVESIKDSVALIGKIKQPDDPLNPYFSKGKAPVTRADIISVINDRILPNTAFAFEATKLAELQTSDRFDILGGDKQSEVLAKNRDLLTVLYPDEIAPRDKGLIGQGFGIKLSIKQADSSIWLKAEMVNFLNEILGNEKILENGKNLRQFFDETVPDGEIETFVESIKTYNKKRIPVNSVAIIHKKSEKTADVMLRGRNDKVNRKLFTVSTIHGKKWKILRAKEIDKDLLQAGFIEKKEVRQ